jgi:raffinose/stachyose/melibiose transport system permease protein
MSAIQGIPNDLYESAKIDGASPFQVMKRITLPLIMPIVKVNTVLIAVGSLKFFDLVYVMTPGGGPNRATEVLASYLYRRAFTNFEYGYGNALAVLLLVLCFVVTAIINKSFKRMVYEY